MPFVVMVISVSYHNSVKTQEGLTDEVESKTTIPPLILSCFRQ